MIYLNEEEYSILQQDLERTGLTQSKYLRALIMKRPICEKLPIDYYRMLTELSRIGNNLNQIARIANQTGLIKFDKVWSEINAILYIMTAVDDSK